MPSLHAKTTKIVSMKKDKMLGKNQIEDVCWLCSLSKSELNLLIRLKKMVTRKASYIMKKKATGKTYFILNKKATRRKSLILKKKATQRTSFIGHKSLSKKFDLKMLRDLSFMLMQVVKERLADIRQDVETCVDKSNLIKYEINEEFRKMCVKELMKYTCSNRKKRISKLFGIDDLVIKKKKISNGKIPTKRISNGRIPLQ